MVEDPIHQNKDGKWYFWDECWDFEEGPFNTKEEAEKELDEYCRNVLGFE